MRDISKILKPGVNPKDIKPIDFSDPKVLKRLEKIKKEQQASVTRGGGVFFSRSCTCKTYKPVSTKGIIIDRCRKCGGNRPTVFF